MPRPRKTAAEVSAARAAAANARWTKSDPSTKAGRANRRKALEAAITASPRTKKRTAVP
jgi:hypothetical protein